MLSVGALVAVLVADPRLISDDTNLTAAGIFGLGLGTVAWLTVARQPRNGAVWALLGTGFFSAWLAASEVAAILVARAVVPGFTLFTSGDFSLSDLPTWLAWILFPASWAWLPALFLMPTLGFILFPDGRAPSRRWRWLGWYCGVTIAVTSVANAALFRPTSTALFRLPTEPATDVVGTIAGSAFGLLSLGALLSVVALIVRYRRSTGALRQQIRWIIWGACFFVLASAAPMAVTSVVGSGGVPSALVEDGGFVIGQVALIASFGLAITKHRLYDIDVVISKMVTYISLAVVVASIYGGAILILILVFGDPGERGGDLGLVLPFAATALVAVVFEPLLVRLRRFANRLVYGRRAAPYEVLSQLTSRLSDTSGGEGLVDLAQLLRDGTGAAGAVVWLQIGDRLRVAAVSPPGWRPLHVDSVVALPSSDVDLSVPVRHGGESLGALGITKPRTYPVTPADETLVADVAAAAGLLLHNMRLNAELGARAAEIQASRRRLIAAQDASRHRLERDLHDGAQQQVVALKVKLGLAQTIAEREGATEVAARVADLSAATQQAVDSMRMVARGIYPPLLEAEGLGAALDALRRTSDWPVQIDSGNLPRYSKQLEGTVYFCVVAALARAKMAGATVTRVGVRPGGASLSLIVTYDAADRGDLTPLADRVEAFGGAVTTTASSDGTTVAVDLPLEDHAPSESATDHAPERTA